MPGIPVNFSATWVGWDRKRWSFRAIVDGETDQYPEAAFFNVGTISDVEEKTKALEKEGI